MNPFFHDALIMVELLAALQSGRLFALFGLYTPPCSVCELSPVASLEFLQQWRSVIVGSLKPPPLVHSPSLYYPGTTSPEWG